MTPYIGFLFRCYSNPVQATERPVFLAGGLSAANVANAIKQVRPYALDLCSGVRTDGQLDPEKLAAFVLVVEQTDAELASARPAT